MSNSNKDLISKSMQILKDMKVEVKTTQLYELFSRLCNEKNWNVASSKRTDLGLCLSNFKNYNFAPVLKEKFSTGVDKLDEDLRGGLNRCSVITVFGSSNSGKSLFAISLGCAALRSNLKVLHINLAGTKEEAALRYMSNLTGIAFHKIEENLLSNEEKNKKSQIIDRFDNQLLVKNFFNFETQLSDIENYCTNIYKEFSFDVIVLDSVQLLLTHREVLEEKKQINKNLELSKFLFELSQKLNCTVISPVFTAKIKYKNMEKDSLPLIKVKDHFDLEFLCSSSDYIFTLNRSESEERQGRLRIFLEWQQQGKKEISYGIKASYSSSNLLINDYYDLN